MPPDVLHQGAHPTWCNILLPYWMVMSWMAMMSSISSLTHAGNSYKRCHMAPLGFFLPWGHLRVRYLYTRWLTHWWHPCFWSLLPSKIIDWVEWFVITMMCLHCMDAFTHSRSVPWALLFSLLVPFCRIALHSVGASVHCIYHVD